MISKAAGLILLSFTFTRPILAQSRTYAGIFNSRWRTVGLHGHDQPLCAPIKVTYFPNGARIEQGPRCNPIDFARGNLDNSIGFRVGREKDYLTLGPLSLVGGAEAAMSYTEYNLTQVDFALLSATLNGGADLQFGGIRFGARAGLAPFATSDGDENGVATVRAVHLSIPIANGVAFRITRQTFNVIDPHRGVSGRLRRDPRAAET